MQIRDLTMSEADYLQAVCNFTPDENILFEKCETLEELRASVKRIMGR